MCISECCSELCVDWRKALRSMCRLNPRTHCDLITALSSQIPLIVSRKKKFAKFINRCLIFSHNTTLQFISCVAINNPFSRTGTNYKDLLNYHGILNSNNVMQSEWSKSLIPLHNDVKTLQELRLKMGIKNASISLKKTSIILLQTYTLNKVCFIYLFPFYIDMYFFIYIIYVLSLTLPLYYCYVCIILCE